MSEKAGESVKHRCEGTKSLGFHSRRCKNAATFNRDGKWYCKQHDPVSKAEYERLRDAKWDAKWKARDEIREHVRAIQAAKDAVVEAAKAWATSEPPWEKVDDALRAAVARLNALENANG